MIDWNRSELVYCGDKRQVSVLEEVAAERKHQIDKGYDADNDDYYVDEELWEAANFYMKPYSSEDEWPWPDSPARIGKTRENLIKAAALIIAEIERMDRRDANKNT